MEACIGNRKQVTYEWVVSGSFDLPFDIIFYILAKLPVKILIRFKLVSRTWFALIENPSFIKAHRTRLKQNPNPNQTHDSCVLVLDYDTKGYKFWLQSSNNTCSPIFNPIFPGQSFPYIVGICDGLVCITSIDYGAIFNPTTRRICKTPRFGLMKKEVDTVFSGFELQDNEYKLFRIVYPNYQINGVVRAEVYSMSTDIWTQVEVKMKRMLRDLYTPGETYFDFMPVAKNGVFYWKARTRSYVPCVVSFDTNGYVFDMLACPEEINRNEIFDWELVDVKGKLALATICKRNCLGLWVLNGKKKSWTIELRVEHPSSIFSPKILGCERNGNLTVQCYSVNSERKLFSYDKERRNFTPLPFSGVTRRHYVYIYTESLLLV